MNYQEFGEGMDLLKKTWDRTYSEPRVRIIFEKVKHLTRERWLVVVDSLISECRQAPLVAEICEMMRSASRDENIIPLVDFTNWNKPPDCNYCNDNGVYVCKSRKRDGIWAFRCHCTVGLSDRRTAIPQFKAAHSAEFYFYDIIAIKAQLAGMPQGMIKEMPK